MNAEEIVLALAEPVAQILSKDRYGLSPEGVARRNEAIATERGRLLFVDGKILLAIEAFIKEREGDGD